MARFVVMASLEMSKPHSVCLMLLYFTNFSVMLINNWLVVMKLASNIIKKWADGMGLPLEMEGYVH
jgi:hypothetical protein